MSVNPYIIVSNRMSHYPANPIVAQPHKPNILVGASQFKKLKLTETKDERLLILKRPVYAKTRTGGRDWYNEAEIALVFQMPQKTMDPVHNLKLIPAKDAVAQAYEIVRDAVARSHYKSVEYLHGCKSWYFDYTAVSYVCGFLSTCVAFDIQFKAPVEMADVALLSSSAFGVSANEVVITRELYRNATELYTLIWLLSYSGVKTVYMALGELPKLGTERLNGEALAVYLLKVQEMIITTANDMRAGAMHASAFFRGQNGAVTLRAHTDEGGWIRRMLREITTCAPIGVITNVDLSVSPYFTDEGRIYMPVRHSLIDMFIQCVDCSVCADPGCEIDGASSPQVLMRVEHDDRLSHMAYYGVQESAPRWYRRFLENISTVFRLAPPSMIDTVSIMSYFHDEREDRHFSRDSTVITPWVWVEQSAVATGVINPPYLSFSQVKTAVPLWNGNVYKGQGYHEECGYVSAGSTLALTTAHTCLREHGITYLYGRPFNKDDGLINFKLAAELERGYASTPACVADGDTLAELLWVTPDNPLISPLNGVVTGDGALFSAMCSRPAGFPTYDEFCNTKVEVWVGLIYPSTEEYRPLMEKNISRNVPTRVKRDFIRANPFATATEAHEAAFIGVPNGRTITNRVQEVVKQAAATEVEIKLSETAAVERAGGRKVQVHESSTMPRDARESLRPNSSGNQPVIKAVASRQQNEQPARNDQAVHLATSTLVMARQQDDITQEAGTLETADPNV
jgi:hypothetical protein